MSISQFDASVRLSSSSRETIGLDLLDEVVEAISTKVIIHGNILVLALGKGNDAGLRIAVDAKHVFTLLICSRLDPVKVDSLVFPLIGCGCQS